MDGAIYSSRVDDIEYIKFCGTVRYSHCSGLEAHIDKIFGENEFAEIVIDLKEADILDSTALGLMARIAIEFKKRSELQPVVFVRKGELYNILKRVCFDQVFRLICDEPGVDSADNYQELESVSQDEQQVLNRVIEAHRYLAQIDASNEKLFEDITQALKK
ncbi:STAS domain-containing protein [Aliikangiella sp. G2MR2-5]|uniref:STAS domain-containing protein n=1 Tax=Aliikangiella sp. G2MR2-5 TaxID=2788943 RepID=UPI0018A9AEB9|nr:STAS domain-containing protein [Aliikangiella sp. G2MR2-5]